MALHLRDLDRDWATDATRQQLLEALAQASRVQRQVDAALTVCRVELARRRPQGSGHSAADEAAAKRATGYSKSESRRQQRRADAAKALPQLGEALAEGKVSGAHLDAVADVVPTEMLDSLGDRPEVLGSAATDNPDEFRSNLRDFVADEERARGIDRAEKQRARRCGFIRKNLRTGMIELTASWEPTTGSAIQSVVRAEYRRLASADQQDDHPERQPERTPGQRMADALANVIRGSASAGSSDDRLPVVIVERPVLEGTSSSGRCEVEGEPVSVETARRATCDRRVDILTLDRLGKPISLDTLNRHANSKQRRALEVIYRGCAMEGCGVTIGDCHIHHIVPWDLKNESALIDLIPLCTRHHHMIHEGGWTLTRTADWIDRWISPDGQLIQRKPDPPLARGVRAA